MRLPVTLTIYASAAVFVCLVSAVNSTDKTGTGQVTAQEIEADIRARGAGRVLIDLHAKLPEWNLVYRGIASGDAAWLRVGQQLASGADAGWARQIDLAFGDALRAAPERVLEMAPSVGDTCGDIDQPFTKTLQKALAEVARREAAVRRISDARLAAKKSECLKGLAELREALPRAFAK